MNINFLKFLSEATTDFNKWLDAIDSSETYEDAKAKGNAAIGYVDCMISFMNSQVSSENNNLTEQLDEVLEDWEERVYQHMADKAIETNQPKALVMKLLKKRDGEA